MNWILKIRKSIVLFCLAGFCISFYAQESMYSVGLTYPQFTGTYISAVDEGEQNRSAIFHDFSTDKKVNFGMSFDTNRYVNADFSGNNASLNLFRIGYYSKFSLPHIPKLSPYISAGSISIIHTDDTATTYSHAFDFRVGATYPVFKNGFLNAEYNFIKGVSSDTIESSEFINNFHLLKAGLDFQF